jgi:hypothetical protein
MNNLEKIKGAIKNGQSRENQRGNQEWTIQRKPKGQSRMDNPDCPFLIAPLIFSNVYLVQQGLNM